MGAFVHGYILRRGGTHHLKAGHFDASIAPFHPETLTGTAVLIDRRSASA
ncbi:MAG TPA: hypothetical protein VGC86_10705 [Afipia sp.]